MKEIENQCWERIEKVFRQSGEMSLRAFALKLGLARGENLYQIKRGKNGISMGLAELINRRYPQFSVAWLVTGEPLANRSHEEDQNSMVKLPFFEDFRPAGYSKTDEPDKYLYMSEIMCRGAEVVTVCRDNSMLPKLVNGSYIFLKRWDGDILYGNIYFIQTKNFQVFRTIRKSENEGRVKLVSSQPKNYDDMEIGLEEIESLWLVSGSVIPMY